MKKIAIINLKGGVAKTTTAANFAANLAKNGYRVLLIDCDKQGNLTRLLRRLTDGFTLTDVLLGKCSAEKAVIKTAYENLDLIPADINLLEANQLITAPDCLGKALQKLEYDYCIFDCAPNIDMIALNVLTCADEVIVPVKLDEDEQEILLILLNEQQEKSDYEKIQDAMRLKELISKKKRDENISGSVRSLTAEALGETPTQIARYESINKNLVPELKEELKDGRMGISAAYEASRLEPEQQQQIMQQPDRTIKTVKKLSESDKLEKQNKKAQREQLKENFKDYICVELCKHTGKREDNLMKQCARCQIDEFLEGLK